MKKVMKKMVSMAAATAIAVGMMGIVTPVMKADAAAGALSEDEIMPLYELADIHILSRVRSVR